jgi:hypothetical protein
MLTEPQGRTRCLSDEELQRLLIAQQHRCQRRGAREIERIVGLIRERWLATRIILCPYQREFAAFHALGAAAR